MFIGHLAPAFAARAITDEAPRLGVLFFAAQLVDIAFFSFALVGLENFRIVPGITAMSPLDLYDYPITHSLLGTALWAAGLAIIVGILMRNAVAATWAAVVTDTARPCASTVSNAKYTWCEGGTPGVARACATTSRV